MTLHASYGEAFTRFAETVPGDERATRAQAFARFTKTGFPDRSQERWHYTDLSSLAQLPVQLAQHSGLDVSRWQLAGCEERIWINGEAQPADAADSGTASSGSDGGLAALHQAFARSGANLNFRGAQSQPLHLLFVSDAQQAGEMHHLSHRLSLERGAEAVVIVQNVGSDGAEAFSTHSLNITLADNAKLTLLRVQNEGVGNTQCLQTQASIGRDASLRIINIDLGGKLIRNDWLLRLDEPGALVEIHGLSAADGRAHLDNQYEIEHAAPHGNSRQYFRGLGFGRSKTILNDRVLVRPGAAKTDSEQRIANLMLSKGAEIDAKPELEIYADDVKCAHGASCGQLDETAVFYLRSRGVPQATARALLTYSFVNEILRHMPHDQLRQRVATIVTGRLGAELDLDGVIA